MSRSAQPPGDFQCPYRDHCPHLEGLSTQWVWDEYQRGPIDQQEQWAIIEEQDSQLQQAQQRIRQLERQLAETQAQLHLLHRRQFKANQPSPPPGDGAAPEAASAPPKRGAAPGHPGWQRPPPDHIDRRVRVSAPTCCPLCGCTGLLPLDELHEHLQEDIVLQPRTVVTCYEHQQALCGQCRRALIQAADGELLRAPIGPVAKATAVYLRYRLGLPYRKVRWLFDEVFGLHFVPASALGFDRLAARRGAPLYEDLRAKIRASALAHADETGWRVDGQNHFLWYAGHAELALFHIDRHRSGEVAQAILGERFGGTLVTDDYAAYQAVQADYHQRCLRHLLSSATDIGAALELLRPQRIRHPRVERFLAVLTELLQQACAAGHQRHSPASGKKLERHFLRRLDKLCARALSYADAETLRQRLLKERHELFGFLRRPGVPPTNNQAEQSLRASVIMRKITFGNRSVLGARTHSILASLLHTARRQRRDPRLFFKTLLLADTATAQAALYKNSS
jgi:transposase